MDSANQRIAGGKFAIPFPGLRPFRPDEAYFFFGRESQVDTMVDKLAASRFLAVVGTSGSGKSSLVNCGLRPALHRGLMAKTGTSWRVAQFRPGTEPIAAMAKALSAKGVLYADFKGPLPLEEIVDTHLRMSKRGLVDIFRKSRPPADTNLLVVADQFEELFRFRGAGGGSTIDTHTVPESAIAFVNLILEARAEPDCPIYVVITMRSDFLGDCAQFEGLPEAINQGQYLVPRMTREERRAAVAGPVGVAGGEMSPALLTRLINDVGDSPDQLSILQHALNRTWAHWQHDADGVGPVLLAHYEAIGGMEHALDRHAEKAFGELRDGRSRLICEQIFKTLTDKGTDARGIRRPKTLATLCAVAGVSETRDVEDVINVFRQPSRSFLMPPLADALEPGTVIDISHESLMRVWERLKKWTDEEAQSARVYRRLAETAALHATGNAGLWRDPELQRALNWKEKQQPTAAWCELYQGGYAVAMSFLEDSKLARDMEVAELELGRQLRRLGALLGIVLIGVYFFFSEDLAQPITDWLKRILDRLSQGPVANATTLRLLNMLAMAFVAAPFFLAYLALAYCGERVLRGQGYQRSLRLWHRILDEVTARTTGWTGGGRAAPLPAAGPKPDSTAALAPTSYASLGRRGACALLSLVSSLTILVIISDETLISEDFDLLTLLGAAWLYSAFMTISTRQGTLAKVFGGLMVTDARGNRLSFGRASVRHFAKFLLLFTIIGVWPIFSKKRQGLHDLIAGTVVLRRPEGGTPSWIFWSVAGVVAALVIAVVLLLFFVVLAVSGFF